MLIGSASCHFLFTIIQQIKRKITRHCEWNIATRDIYKATKEAIGLTAGVTNLNTGLTDMHRDDFTHFSKKQRCRRSEMILEYEKERDWGRGHTRRLGKEITMEEQRS